MTGRLSIFPKFTRLESGRAPIGLSLWNLHLTTSYTVSQGWGLTNGVCRSSLFRGAQGPPALAVESDRQSRRWASELVCGRSVPGKLAHRCPPRCRGHQADVPSHSLSLLATHTAHTHTDVTQQAGRKKGTRRQSTMLQRGGEARAFYFLP